MFVSLLPLISVTILLLADICVLNIGKFKLIKALEAGCEWAEHECRLKHGEFIENDIKQVCVQNCPEIKQLSITKFKDEGKTSNKVCIEISACIDMPTSILINEGRKCIRISSKRKRVVPLSK